LLGQRDDVRTVASSGKSNGDTYGEPGRALVSKLLEWLVITPKEELLALQGKLHRLFDRVKDPDASEITSHDILYQSREDNNWLGPVVNL